MAQRWWSGIVGRWRGALGSGGSGLLLADHGTREPGGFRGSERCAGRPKVSVEKLVSKTRDVLSAIRFCVIKMPLYDHLAPLFFINLKLGYTFIA